MAILREAVEDLTKLIGKQESAEVVRMAKKAEQIERKYNKEAEKLNEELLILAYEVIQGIRSQAEMQWLLIKYFMSHMVDTTMQSMGMIESRMPAVPKKARLAKRERSLSDWMRIWDEWRTKRKPTKEIQKRAESVLKSYLEATKKWFHKQVEPLQTGEMSRVSAAKILAKQIKAPLSRTKTIVDTETTRYWNTVRQDFYRGEPQITHYLLMAIRDHRTTKWCRTRHGLVYEKDDPELPPPFHWNCRSEILPLTPFNPRHQNLIQDKSRARRNNRPEPLPKGWKPGG